MPEHDNTGVANQLEAIMSAEGLSNSELARLANLSDRTIAKARKGEDVSINTQNKIVRALNINPTKIKRNSEYTRDTVFPQPKESEK